MNATCSPRRRAGNSSQAQLRLAPAGSQALVCSWGWRASRTHRSRPAPSQDSPGAAPRVRRLRPPNSARRLSGLTAVAPPLRAPLAPAGAPWESACGSILPPPSLLPFPPPSCSSRGAGHSLTFLPPRSSSQFPSRGGSGGGGGAENTSAATELLRLERASSLAAPRPFPAAPLGTLRLPPTPALASLTSGRGAWQNPVSIPPGSRGERSQQPYTLRDSCPSDPGRQGVP